MLEPLMNRCILSYLSELEHSLCGRRCSGHVTQRIIAHWMAGAYKPHALWQSSWSQHVRCRTIRQCRGVHFDESQLLIALSITCRKSIELSHSEVSDWTISATTTTVVMITRADAAGSSFGQHVGRSVSILFEEGRVV